MNKEAEKENLAGFEKVKKLRIVPTSFMNYGIFTSTLKLQRHVAQKVFEKDIEQMYKE